MTGSFAKILEEKLADHRDPQAAEPMRKYMRDQFEFFGIDAKHRRALLEETLAEHGLPPMPALEKTVRLLWKLPERECQYCAQDLLQKRSDELTLEHIPLLEYMITNKSWWDTVDFIATNLVGPLLREQYAAAKWKTGEWLDTGNLWLARTTLLFQLKYKGDTNPTLLAMAIKYSAKSDQFFIQKAIGWALREYAKSEPDWVREYVERTHLSPLSRKEALKNLKRQD